MTQLITTSDIIIKNDTPRITDRALARGLGYKSTKQLRQSIERNRLELEQYGEIIIQEVVSPQIEAKPLGGRPNQEYLLTEQQALTIACFAKTANAALLRAQMVAAFLAIRKNDLPEVPKQPLKMYVPPDGVSAVEFWQLERWRICYHKQICFWVLTSMLPQASLIKAWIAGRAPIGSDIPSETDIRAMRRAFNGDTGIPSFTMETFEQDIARIKRLITELMRYELSLPKPKTPPRNQ